jgi:hypothetical protein
MKKMGQKKGFQNFIDALRIHVPEDLVICEMSRENFEKSFFNENHEIIRTADAYFWINNEYDLVFCCKRDG